jgi:zinc transport system ATP-binding protein
MNTVVAELQDIWVRYGEYVALEDINLSIKQDDFLGIIGPNGGGKTTLLKVLLGLVQPFRGRVGVFGEAPRKTRRFIGYVPQSTHIDREFPVNVRDVILSGRLRMVKSFQKYGKEDRIEVDKILEKVGISDLRNQQIGKLSGGQLQRVLIARALVTEPKMLMLDEPTASIDTRMETDLYQMLRRLNQEIPILLVSHDIGVLSLYVKTIACLNRKLICHNSHEITADMLEAVYHCPVQMIAHGVPHRVLGEHPEATE